MGAVHEIARAVERRHSRVLYVTRPYVIRPPRAYVTPTPPPLRLQVPPDTRRRLGVRHAVHGQCQGAVWGCAHHTYARMR